MKYYLSACAIVRNESLYIRDWILFHLKQGIEHFYIYENGSTDNTKEVLAEFTPEQVTLIDFPGDARQSEAYNDCIWKYREETEWCAFIDIDEYLWSTEHEKISHTIRFKYDDGFISGMCVHWLMFGSNNQLTYSPEHVCKRFTRRGLWPDEHVKSIMRLCTTKSVGSDPHSFRAENPIIDETFREMPREYAKNTPATADILRINHFHCKSKSEHDLRRLAPDANTGVFNDKEKMWENADQNDFFDDGILARL